MYEAIEETTSQACLTPLVPPASPWLKIYHESESAKVRLYCFSHVGGAASVFKQWHHFLPEDIEVCAIQLPGREERQREVLCEDIEQVANKLISVILADTRPFIFFGHSFGSILAFTLASRLKKIGFHPAALIVSAKAAPHLPSKKQRSNLPRVQLIQELLAMGGTPESFLKDTAMMDRVLRVIRADYSVLESFKPSNYLDALDCSIFALEASEDNLASSAGIDAWCEYTTSTFRKHLISGGHFYIKDHPQALFAVIKAALTKIAF